MVFHVYMYGYKFIQVKIQVFKTQSESLLFTWHMFPCVTQCALPKQCIIYILLFYIILPKAVTGSDAVNHLRVLSRLFWAGLQQFLC